MRATVDSQGRITIPDELRKQAGIEPGMEVELRWCGDHFEATPSGAYRLERRGPFLVAVLEEPSPTVSAEEVNEIIEELRLHPFGPAGE
ncbi:MAG: AbrB/MazE/SpoVT family DNA-binding domain-containing protein [Dehalococcoidia bacterium]|nr:AbrB/MazE/SpoVT family DNA-binding domain-containing protein [Dehalococcoidia bacterium]